MISSNYRFTLDLHALQSQISLPAKVGDTQRKLYISLSSGGNPYRIADGCGAKITIMRETGTWVEDINCEIEDNTTIVHDFSKVPATAAVAGVHECELTLYGPAGEVLGTPRFTLLVDERLIALKDVGLTDEDYTIVDSIAAAEIIRKNSEVVRTLSETERKGSEIVRISQEAARQKNEASRVSVETDRNEAEKERIKKENSRILSETDRANAEIDRMNQEALRRSAENERDRKDADRDARINGAVRVADEAKEKALYSVDKVEEFDQELGDESIVSGHGTVKAAVNHAVITSDTALERANITHRNLVNISAQVQGIGRSYVVPDFMSFLDFLIGADFIKLSEDRDGDGVNENYFVYISDLKTGDNIIIAEKSVPDFWFEKNAALTSFEHYTYKGTEYELSAKENGVILGGAHVLETDYTVIEGFSLSAAVSANNAYASEMNASGSEAKAVAAQRATEQSAAQAGRSETNAKTSETNAKTSEDNAAASEKAAEEAAGKAAGDAQKIIEEFYEGLNIAQKTGDSDKAVMSQKAVTDEFNKQRLAVNNQSANALKGKASGEAVVINDVSPIEHTIDAKVKSKNLFDITKATTTSNGFGGCEVTHVGANSMTITSPNNYSGNGNCSTGIKLKDFCPQLKVGDVVTLSFVNHSVSVNNFFYLTTFGDVWKNGTAITITDTMLNSILVVYGSSLSNESVTISNIQVELGTVATEYSPFVDVSVVKVKAQGKNLIPFPYVDTTKTTNGITFTDNGDGSITANGTATDYAYFILSDNLTIDTDADINAIGREFATDGKYTISKGLNYNVNYHQIALIIRPNTTVNNEIFYPQAELGTEPTEYEPYNIKPREYTVNADGTIDNLYSIYPTTTLIADTPNVTIDAEYNKDANKVVASLEERIAALEAMIINN